MTDSTRDTTGSGLRWAIAVAVVLALLGAFGGWVYWHLYVPRHPSIAHAIVERDRADVARFGRGDPTSLDTWTGDPRHFDPTSGFYDEKTRPLELAIAFDDAETVALLLRFGADPNAGATVDELPLSIAAARSPAITRLLVAHGADVHASNLVSGPPILSLILSDASVPYLGKAQTRSADDVSQTLDALVAGGLDMHRVIDDELTPVHAAANVGAFNVLAALLDRGADIDATAAITIGEHHMPEATALHAVILGRRPRSVVAALLAHGADPHRPVRYTFQSRRIDHEEPHALAFALSMWRSDAIAAMLAHGVEPDPAITNSRGYTLLHWAVAVNNADAVALLLKTGADPERRESSGKRPIDLLRPDIAADPRIAELLGAADAARSTSSAPESEGAAP